MPLGFSTELTELASGERVTERTLTRCKLDAAEKMRRNGAQGLGARMMTEMVGLARKGLA